MPSLFRELPDISETRDEIRREQAQRYAPFGLQLNPFPLAGNFPEGYIEYTYLEDSDLRTVADFLLNTFRRSEFNGLLVLGGYGTGKSHLLHFIHDFVVSDPEKVFQGRALAFLIGNPGLAPEDIMLALLSEIKIGTLQDLIFLPVKQKLEKEYSGNTLTFLKDFTTYKGQQKLTTDLSQAQSYNPDWYQVLFNTDYRQFTEILKEHNVVLDTDRIRDYSRKVIFEEVTEDPIIVDGLLGLIFNTSAESKSWESFLVNSFMKKRGSTVGIEYYLGALLRLFEIMGVNHVYLLVDELEDLRTSRLSSRAASEYLAALRRMIQHNYKSFSFVLASTRDAWKELKLYYPAIDDRFPENSRIDLARSPKQIKSVVLTYLSKSRSPNSEQIEDQWYPFTEELIDRVINTRERVLRHILTECRLLLDKAVEAEISPPLPPEFLDQI